MSPSFSFSQIRAPPSTQKAPSLSPSSSPLPQEEAATVKLFERARHSVVHVSSPSTSTRRGHKVPSNGSGTGFIWDSKGHVVTNYHVVKGCNKLVVREENGKEHEGVVVGVDTGKDVAVLKLEGADGEEMKILERGSSKSLKVGQRVFAIGSPFGLDCTLTTGIVSGVGREINSSRLGERPPLFNIIQTDAAISMCWVFIRLLLKVAPL